METDGDNRGARPPRARAESPYLNTAQAAKYLGLSARTLEAMRSGDDGPPYRYHGKRRIRYHINDLDAWSAAHRRHTLNGENKQGELPFHFADAKAPHRPRKPSADH